jgi:hypothetical protein
MISGLIDINFAIDRGVLRPTRQAAISFGRLANSQAQWGGGSSIGSYTIDDGRGGSVEILRAENGP